MKNIMSVSSHNTSAYILPPHYTVNNIVSHCFTFQFQRLLEEAAVEKERLVMELQYVIFLVLDAIDINDGVHE